ncbi:MarR family winged helix-turn-helix transcriptional regulator [Burkholderia gladioli]|uniref:MarR family transcriptional regulator n=1 Tax=Burkholderia gladioli TaxID=28095 RepID=A0A2A7S075_BURGA|nr:MarR family winged helix-turn-helix transcriptional regulator [Burkholderia gladioli]ATF86363.1 MarR family transcriptional regulator [Burkholderia gladioli pv. gladioli]MBJ9710953.1 winged helix-turn-helix transcriptional regulator [Burkholderia gladioli]MBU9155756.1 MarR family winged helix-turn-helix transcriptional regulator [Burkholderia gladioli]MBU9194397.1 MarR family winged helix-turn-helix transcriptional regulator [Burkholderia gladioli]MBU9216613.1 MarR family winged helix-turn-
MHREPPDTDHCFAIRQAARHVSRFYELYLSQAGVTPSQFSILRFLSEQASATMLELARATSTDRTTLVRTLKPLLREALVLQTQDEGGGRRQRFTLTPAGQCRLAEAMRHWHAAQAAFEGRFGAPRAQALDQALAELAREFAPDGAPA